MTSHIVIWRKEQALVIVIGRVDIKASVPGLWRIRLPWPAVGKSISFQCYLIMGVYSLEHLEAVAVSSLLR